jgi:T5orf172 domain-containing protein
MHEEPILFGGHDAITGHSLSWFVYLFPSADCSSFKVGFSCNPLHRIYTFSRRYFERFDLGQSWLLQLDACDEARAVEARLKTALADFRVPAPAWVPAEAGGHTEWFSAVQLRVAEELLRSSAPIQEAAQLVPTSDYVRGELHRASRSFETWVASQAQFAWEASRSPRSSLRATEIVRAVRDWLDAYRYFDLRLFEHEPSVMEFVTHTARALPGVPEY